MRRRAENGRTGAPKGASAGKVFAMKKLFSKMKENEESLSALLSALALLMLFGFVLCFAVVCSTVYTERYIWLFGEFFPLVGLVLMVNGAVVAQRVAVGAYTVRAYSWAQQRLYGPLAARGMDAQTLTDAPLHGGELDWLAAWSKLAADVAVLLALEGALLWLSWELFLLHLFLLALTVCRLGGGIEPEDRLRALRALPPDKDGYGRFRRTALCRWDGEKAWALLMEVYKELLRLMLLLVLLFATALGYELNVFAMPVLRLVAALLPLLLFEAEPLWRCQRRLARELAELGKSCLRELAPAERLPKDE